MIVVRYLWRAVVAIIEGALGIAAATLPQRHWSALDRRIPVTGMALPSAIATFGVAALLGIPGYFRYAERRTDLVIDSLLVATGWRASAGQELLSETGAQMVWVSGYLAPFTYALLTPTGLFALYLTLSGYFRLAAWYVEQPQGDLLVTFVDSAVVKRRRAAALERSRAERESLEGPEVPDRLITGRAAGIPDAELVVVSSRRKPGWEAGVFVITPDTWYRLGQPVERTVHAGLRTLYPLTEIHDLEARRKSVQYELPPLSGAHTERTSS